MYGFQLYDIISRDERTLKMFKGIHSLQSLTSLKQIENGCYIVNTTKYGEVGHWLVLFVGKDCNEVFDSLARDIREYSELYQFLIARGGDLKYSCKVVQDSKSRLCGLFCIVYIYFKGRGYSMKNILHFFSHSVEKNDMIVISFINNYLN